MFFLAAGLLAASLSASSGGAAVAQGRWVPGDLDLHSTYSTDVCPTPPTPSNCDPMTRNPADAGYGPMDLVNEAAARGLEFVAITDRDVPKASSDASAQNDPDIVSYKRCHILTPDVCPVLVLDGTEKTLYDSVTGFSSGTLAVVGYSTPSTASTVWFPNDPTPNDRGWSTTDLKSALSQLHASGDLVFADRPASPPFTYNAASLAFDGWYVWNGLYADQSEFTGAAAANDPQADQAWMNAMKDVTLAGKQLPVVGGSDTRRRILDPVQGPGEPTLWVYDTVDWTADDPLAPPTWLGIHDAIAKGHTMIGALPPSDNAPKLYLETTDGQYMAGDTLPLQQGGQATYTLRVRYENAPPGAKIRVVGNSPSGAVTRWGPEIQVQLPGGSATVTTAQFVPGRWYRAEMFVEDLLDPTERFLPLPAPAPQQVTVPGRSTLPCAPVWITSNPCLTDRWTMLGVTSAMVSATS
jgi:hypothetical protein